MAKQKSIADIPTDTDEWRVKVLVAAKSNIHASDAHKRLQKLLLIDQQGEKVEGMLWNINIDMFERRLLPFCTCIIGGAKIETVKQGFQFTTPGITTQWVLSRGTFIREVTDEHEKIPYPGIHNASIANIQSLADTQSTIDAVMVVLDVKQPRLVEAKGKLTPIRECTVVQQELRPVMLTIWSDFVEKQGAELLALKDDQPIIFCKSLRIAPYSGLSLSTIPFSFVSINPDIPEVITLREWAENHRAQIAQISNKPIHNYLEAAITNKDTIHLSQLSTITPDLQAKNSLVSVDIADITQKITYAICPKCNQTQKAIPEESFFCDTCNEDQIAAPRSKIVVQLTDKSRTTPATLFDKNADKFLQLIPQEARNMDTKAMAEHLRQIKSGLKGKEIIARINAKNFADNVIRYTIQDWAEHKLTKLSDHAQSEKGQSSTPAIDSQLCIEDSTSKEATTTSETPETQPQDKVGNKTKAITTVQGTATPEKTSGPMKKTKAGHPIRETNTKPK